MTERKKAVYKNGTSPIVPFDWPKIDEPDFGTEKFPNENGEFSTKIVLDRNDAEQAAFIDALEAAFEPVERMAESTFAAMPVKNRKALEKLNGANGIAANDLFTPIYDEQTEEETSKVTLKLKLPYRVTFKRGPKAGKTITNKLAVYDAKGQIMRKVPKAGGGTLGRVSFSYDTAGYFIEGSGRYGLKLRLEGVQIIELVEFGSSNRSAEAMGFGAVEGGYEAGPNDFSDETEGTTSDDDQFTSGGGADDDADF